MTEAVDIEPARHLSPGAQNYLRNPDVLEYPTDWTDPWSVQEFRDIAHPLWCEANNAVDFEYQVREDTINDVVVERISVGSAAPNAAILHLHGGMYCLGTPEIDRALTAPIARSTGIEVVSVDYRLAPEHPFPAALDDALAVYTGLVDAGHDVAIVGESAGGGLAAATALAIRDRQLAAPAALVLISPMLDLTGSSDTFTTLRPVDPDYFDPAVLLEPGAAYAAGEPLDNPLLSPLFGDLAGLAPTLVQVGGREVLLGDSIRFAQKARRAGVDVTLEVADGCWHNYPIWYGVPEADAAVAQLTDHIRTHLATAREGAST